MDRRLFTTTAVLLVCLSVIATIPPALAQAGQMHVNWNETTETFMGNFTWDSISWEFGPYPKLEIKYLNDTPVTSAVQHGVWLKFILNVPKTVLEGADLGGAEVGFETHSSHQQANVYLKYCADCGWDIWSEVFNITGDGTAGGKTTSPRTPEHRVPIFDFWEAQSQFLEEINQYTIVFVGRLNDMAPYGTYHTWTGVFDSEGNYFMPGFSYYSNQSPYIEFVLGSPSGFIFNLTDLSGVPLSALSRGDEFQIRINSTAITIGLAELVINTQNFVQIDESWWEPVKLFFTYERGKGVNVTEGVEFWYYNETTEISEYIRILNETLTLFTPTGNATGDDFVIFQGYLTNNLESGILDLWIDVFDTLGCWIPPVTYRDLLISIDSSLNVIKIFDPNTGDFVNHVNYSQWFNASIQLYGNNSLLDNMSAVRFSLSGYEYDQMTGDSVDAYVEIIYNLSSDSVTENSGTLSHYYSNGSYVMNPISNPFDVAGVYDTRTGDHILVMFNVSFTVTAPEFVYCCINAEALDNNSMPVSFNYQSRSVPWQLALGDVNPDFWWEKFAITDEGAIDIDGDLETTDDQFFVKRLYQSNDTFSTTVQYMWVDIMWDPTPGAEGDELFSHIDMGLISDSFEFNWSETFLWLHASNMSVVSDSTFQMINNTIWSEFGYESVNWMTRNATWEDMLGEWWWMDDNTWEYQWFFFSIHEGYMVSATESGENVQVNIAEFGTEYAGLLLFNDTNSNGIPDGGYANGLVDVGESTHFFVIDEVGTLSFMRPFDSTQASGSRTLETGETVDFGVSLQDVNGTLYPLTVSDRIYSAWDFYTSHEVNIEDQDFDRTVESAAIDEISFMAHFSAADIPGTNKTEASIKVDQYIGDWDLTHFPNGVLQDRSLAISYYAQVSQISFQFAADDMFVGTDENSTTADEFTFTSNGTEFAKIRMGGSTYVWGKDDGTYTTNSSTTPFGTFKAMYEGHKDSVSSFNVTSQMYFMTIGFTNWDGYSVDNDPEFVVFPETFQGVVGDSILFIAMGAAVVVVLVAAVLVIKRRRI